MGAGASAAGSDPTKKVELYDAVVAHYNTLAASDPLRQSLDHFMQMQKVTRVGRAPKIATRCVEFGFQTHSRIDETSFETTDTKIRRTRAAVCVCVRVCANWNHIARRPRGLVDDYSLRRPPRRCRKRSAADLRERSRRRAVPETR